jgi:hypothetical protein
LIPILRVSLPGANIYGGVRQIMEFIPAMALLSGIGAVYLVVILRRLIKTPHINSYAIKALIVAFFIPVLFQFVEYHPYENLYFNFLVGGLNGAKNMDFPYWGTTFGSAYREGAVWLNKNVESGAKLVYVYDLYPNIPRVFLRRDIELNNKYRSGELAKGEYAIGLVYEGSIGRTYYDDYLEKFVEPIHEVKVDGVTILKIWKNEKVYQRYSLTESKITNPTVESKENSLVVKLPMKKKVSRV